MNGKLTMFHIVLLVTFGALAIAGVMVLALANAGGSNTNIGPVTIWGTLPSSRIQSILRQVADEDARFEQVTYEQNDPTTYANDLTNALASGKGPDIFIMRHDEAVRDAEKTLPVPVSTISASQFTTTFVEAANPFFSEQGAVAVPLLVDPLVLFWNRDSLDAAGFANPPKYWGDVLTMVQPLTVRDDAGTIKKSALAFGEFRNIPAAKDIVALLIFQAGGSITGFDTHGSLIAALTAQNKSTQPTVSALRYFTEFADPSKDTYTWSRSLPNAQSAFASGDVALYVGHASESASIAGLNPNLNFAMATIPQIKSGDRTVDTATVYGLAVSRTSRNPLSAGTIAYLMSSDRISRSIADAVHMASALRDSLARPSEGDASILARSALISRTWFDPDPEKTSKLFQAMIEDTTSGASRVDQAATRADKALQEIIAPPRN